MPPTTDEALNQLLADGQARATSVEPSHARLWEAVAVATEGGKRFRPTLVMAAHDALGGTCPAAAAQVGAAVELLHTALVIHDDVIDGDEVRRGRPNVVGTFSAQARDSGAAPAQSTDYGRAAGILAGDLALAGAIRAVATCGADAGLVHRLLDLFDVALHTTAAGELSDVLLSLHVGPATLVESLAMEEQKTSVYSFALPLQAGALLAGADDGTVARIGEAGLMLGVAFQLVDDLIGVFGDPALTGKSTTGDLRTRKQTPLLVHATSTSRWEEIRGYVGRDLTPDELAHARRLLVAAGSRRYVEDLAEAHLAGARTVLAVLGIPGDLVPDLAADLSMIGNSKEVAA
jgi:geranylgeranyl diphosphate synthase type II